MKIAQVCPYDFSRPGGVKSHILSLSKYLRKEGHEVKVIAPRINSDLVQDDHVYLFGSNRSINLGGTKIDINIATGKQWKELKSFLNKEKFDVIHYHTIWNPLLPFQVRWLSKSFQVATFHDTPKNKFIGRWIVPLIARIVFKFLDIVISVSSSQAKLISRFSSKNVHIIPNGIDLDLPNLQRRKNQPLNLLFLGRLEPRKGVIHALKLFSTLKKEYPELVLKIAGEGDERILVEEFISTNQLKDVQLLGAVSEEEKYQLLTNADLYLGTALYGESFGIVLLEAMAMGCPMAGYANSGYLNVLKGHLRDHFVQPGDIDALTTKAAALLEQKSTRESLSNEGLKIVPHYDWQLLSKDVSSLYRRLNS